VELTPPPPERDLEFHGPPEPASVAAEPYLDLENYQRLVANPFLGLLGSFAWLLGLRWVFLHVGLRLTLVVAFLLVAVAPGLPLLFQYHCRDCGASGPLYRWRKHTCAPIAERRRTGQPRRFRGPSPPLQVVIWLYFVLLIGIVWSALGWALPALR
jgi:hypothetical protein